MTKHLHHTARATSGTLALTALCALFGTAILPGPAKANTCVPLFDGLQLCLDDTDLVSTDPAELPKDQYVQTINITTVNGNVEKLVQSIRPGAVKPGVTRICLVNEKGGTRILAHDIANINPMIARPGQSSCANFPSNARVQFKAYTNTDPAKPAKALIYSLSRYDGGVLTLRWQ
ncbi:MAG: hypothetical protein KDK22_05565 [Rhodobacteraceae bacterium]|nr:hypothetical protein [Paracoccaceae bacterium]